MTVLLSVSFALFLPTLSKAATYPAPTEVEPSHDLSFDDLIPTFGQSDKAPDKSEPQPHDLPEIKGKPEDLPAKTATATAAYKVYPAPVIADDEPAVSSASGVKTDKEMMEALLRQSLEAAEKNEDQTGQAQTGQTVPSQQNNMLAPTNAVPTQYFPIFPLGAAPDAPPQFLPLASNRPLTGDQSMTTRAIISIHDLSRNASDALAVMTTLSGSDNGTTLIITPQFPLEIDIMRFASLLPDKGAAIARWPLGADVFGWQSGGDSVAGPRQKGISSFTAMDLLLLFLSNRAAFPNLRQVVLVGHGAGADFVLRYAAVGQAPDMLGEGQIAVRFVAANPSSYLYLTNQRPAATGQNFAIANTTECAGVNAYPYGLGDLAPYARRRGVSAIQMKYPQRHVTVLSGNKIVADPYLDQSCAAKAQGADRLARARNFERYLALSFGDATSNTQSFAYVPNAGYDPVSLYGSYCGLSALFGDGACPQRR
jgi:hypothetical protein